MVPDTAAYRADINCNGVTQDIPIEWKFMDDSHLKVLLTPLATGVSAPLVLGSDYTVTGAGSDDGGNVHTAVAYSSAYRISVVPDLPFDQTVIYTEGEKFPAKSHEGALDKLTLLVRQMKEALNRCVRGMENVSTSYELPPPEAGKALGWVTTTTLGNVPNNAVGLSADLADYASASKGAGMSGFAYALTYAANTVGKALKDLADADTAMDSRVDTLEANVVGQTLTARATTGTSTAYVLTPSPALAAYANNVRYQITPHTDSGASPTINVSGLGAKNLKQYDSSGAKVAVTLLKSGQKTDIVYDGTDFVVMDPLPSSAGTGRLIGYQVFSTPGTASYSKGTNNPSYVIVEVQGAGGSGGVATSTAGPCLATGGGAGGYSLKKINAAALAASETVTVGSGGAAVTSSGANGNNGGTSSFGSHCSATGGLAGAYKITTGPLKGSLGGSASGGDVNSLGGGSSALFASGTEFNAACGGSSRFGGGGAAIASTLAATQTGIAGGIGAGGGGTVVNNSTAGHSSGKGGDGLVIVWEYA